MHRFILTSVVALALGIAGCGSDSSSGSGISSSKKMNELTNAEATTLCKAHQGDFDAIAKGGCVLATAALGGASVCEQQCTSVKGGIDCSATNVSDIAGCTATVGEVENCLDQMGSYYGGLKCGAQPSSNVPSCTASLRGTCGALFGGTTGGGPDGGA